MLIDITVANFRSIKEPQTISFAALKDKRLDQSKVEAVSENMKLLRASAIVGPNGVGKSTMVRALETVKGIITADGEEENPLKRILAGSLFAYNEVKGIPAEFTIRVLLKKATMTEREVIATYTLKVDQDHIWEESLFYTFGTSRKIMFERTAQAGLGELEYKYRWGKMYRGEKKRLEKKISSKHSYLATAALKGGETCLELYKWITESLVMLPMGVAIQSEQYAASVLNTHPSWKRQLINFLWSLDITDIRDVRIGLNKDGKFIESNQGDLIFFIHSNSKAAMFTPYAKESLSMRRLTLMALAFFEAFTSDKVLVIDDYGMFLHPEVIKYLTNVFTTGCKRPSQLFVFDCNPTLLEDGLLRRDGIWFAEKNSEGATVYYPLSDFRFAQGRGKTRALYENGAFGALPITSDFHFVNEEV